MSKTCIPLWVAPFWLKYGSRSGHHRLSSGGFGESKRYIKRIDNLGRSFGLFLPLRWNPIVVDSRKTFCAFPVNLSAKAHQFWSKWLHFGGQIASESLTIQRDERTDVSRI